MRQIKQRIYLHSSEAILGPARDDCCCLSYHHVPREPWSVRRLEEHAESSDYLARQVVNQARVVQAAVARVSAINPQHLHDGRVGQTKQNNA